MAMAHNIPTACVSNIPQSAIAKDLLKFLESTLGLGSVFAIEILTEHKNWKSRGFGRVQFATLEAKSKALSLSLENNLVFKSHYLKISESPDDIIFRPAEAKNRIENGVFRAGFMLKEDCLSVLESWEGVRAWIMPERNRVEFWVWEGEDCYKLEIMFEDILEANGYFSGKSKVNSLLLKLKYGPRIYHRKSGPSIVSKFKADDRYQYCKEDFEFLWVRTTDFSTIKSIGHSTSFCLEIEEPAASDIFQTFPLYIEKSKDLNIGVGKHLCSSSEIVPLVECSPDSKLAYDILFQLISLVHTQKISLASVDGDLINLFSSMNEEIAAVVLQKLHKLKSACYEPLDFVKTELDALRNKSRSLPPSSLKRLMEHNVMSCHRALITPSKIYCLGPELETSNYVVKHYAQYASDFMRVTFVEEDWSKLPATAVSTNIQKEIFLKPFKTAIHERILTVLRDGIVIGAKRFEFLAFSASQLRSNSVWMFASNERVKAEHIRKWMGSFNKIRSISKCAARMGQLFSSSTTITVVPSHYVEIIPDVEVTTDGIDYCFSDGIGKISKSFAMEVAEKCNLDHIPSAFQIRYGGYKGVIAVDHHSFRKLSLRSSMCKFKSNNMMLNVTSWSKSMPCFLNREIITLLSTLGVKDKAFEELQQEQLSLLGSMLTNRKAALKALERLTGADSNNILVKMLLQGYEPNIEPYLSMMLRAHYEQLLSDMKTRCRILVPKGRVLIGCMDETGILNYGQVFVRVTMTKADLQSKDASLREVDESTCVILGKVVVTKNPCLHPGDIRVLDAVYEVELEEKGLRDCLIFPQNGHRPHPNECSGGDLDGDLYFISWDKDLIPYQTEAAMDYTGRRPRIMDHDVTLEEIQQFFVDYMINDTLGAISTAHLVHADREPDKANSKKCLELAQLHSMAVDFAKTGAPAEMPRFLKPREFPDFMERTDKPTYTSKGVLGKLYRTIIESNLQARSNFVWSEKIAAEVYDHDLEVEGFEAFVEAADAHKEMYADKLSSLMSFYDAETEDEMLSGNLRQRAAYLQRDNRRYGDVKDRILLSVKNLQREAKEWFETSCRADERGQMASAWYHVTYHPSYWQESSSCLSFPWIVGHVLLGIKSENRGTSHI